MRKAPSNIALQEAKETRDVHLGLIDGSRSRVGNLFERCILKFLDEFDDRSKKYENYPNDDNLLEMAYAILPVSETTASIYCKMILERNSLHEGAKNLIKSLG